MLFHFLNALFSGLFAQEFSHLFYLRTIVLHILQIILFHGFILHFFFIEPLSCFSLWCKQHCLILWRKYLIEAAGWFVQHTIVVHIFSAKYRFNASANFFAFLTWTAYSTGLYGSPSITGTCHTKIHFFISFAPHVRWNQSTNLNSKHHGVFFILQFYLWQERISDICHTTSSLTHIDYNLYILKATVQ